ncbi:hypothetical protein O6H91_10G049400 [Diphasiastrum complanatum]|uniref:Uncharacterized protein n=1 Tax=Diphasiastrum complanatum TaxID=34168 RepID=A0ACC2CGS3_DIPCM|nr:hypothetical protein O6H91_10G049400 [Diphasiastrum complanatum]
MRVGLAHTLSHNAKCTPPLRINMPRGLIIKHSLMGASSKSDILDQVNTFSLCISNKYCILQAEIKSIINYLCSTFHDLHICNLVLVSVLLRCLEKTKSWKK